MILKTAGGKALDLNACLEFREYLNDSTAFVPTIVDQINSGLYLSYIPKGKDTRVFDIGANIGLTVLHMHDVVKEIIAFEPHPKHFKTLKAMLACFSIPNVVAINSAVGSKDAKATFHTAIENSTVGSLVKADDCHNSESFEVQVESLEKLIGNNPVDLCKIDIEGGEMELQDILASGKLPIKTLFMECHDLTYKKDISGEMLKALSTNWNVARVVDPWTLWAVRK